VTENSTSTTPQPNTFNSGSITDYKAEVDEKRKAKERNKAVLDRQKLRDGCLEMDRITRDILSPEILSAATLVRALNIPLEVIELETESPLDQQIYLLGMRLRFGDKTLPTKIAFEANPETHIFHLYLRVPEKEEVEELIPFHKVIPQLVHKTLKQIFDTTLPSLPYQPKLIEDKFSAMSFKAPFRIQMQEHGKTSEIASTDTLEEAVKMGSTFSSIYKNDTLCIIDAKDQTIC